MKNLWSKSFFLLVVMSLIFGLITVGYAPVASAKDVIKVGGSLPITGIFSAGAPSQKQSQQLWVEQVNARGGIYVKDLGKKLPLEFVFYDDRSSSEEAIKIYTRLVKVDKCDLLLGPWGTGIAVATIPTIEKNGIPCIHTNSGSMRIYDLDVKYNWMVGTTSNSDAVMPALAGLLAGHKDKIKKIAIVYGHDVRPLEDMEVLPPLLKKEGFDIVLSKDYPVGVKDMTQVLLDVKRKGADALIGLSYPADTFLIIGQMMEIGYNPKFYYSLVGPGIAAFHNIFGPATEGIAMMGDWTEKSPAGSKAFYDSYKKRWGELPDYLDSINPWAAGQIYEQAIAIAGTLNPEKLSKVISTNEFNTVHGKIRFDRIRVVDPPGGVQQWQNGKPEVVWPPKIRTSDVVIPKPPWPKK